MKGTTKLAVGAATVVAVATLAFTLPRMGQSFSSTGTVNGAVNTYSNGTTDASFDSSNDTTDTSVNSNDTTNTSADNSNDDPVPNETAAQTEQRVDNFLSGGPDDQPK